ncbi:MAG TPA: hypothetical protein VNO70_13165 [Blastocatellia bacterium]|nr:hypothetical protein [Blastocatellia bacterium]
MIKDKSSQLTEDEDFIFTDCDVSVEDILKDNPVKSIKPGDNITITRPGGTVKLKGRVVRAIDTSFRSFEIGGRYILFLRFIPSTETYKAFSNGSFQLRDNHITKLTNEALWDEKERENDATAFLTEVRDAIAGVRIEAPKGFVRLQ